MSIPEGHTHRPGDLIIVEKFGPDRTYMKTIKRVMVRFIELTDDTQWSHRGDPYPYQSYNYSGGHLSRPTPERIATAGHQRLVRQVKKVRWEDLPLDTLKKVLTEIETI